MVSVFDEQLGVHITPRLRRCMIEGVVPSKAGAQHHVDSGQRITHITHRLVQPGWCALQTCTRDQQRPRERPTGIDRHCCYTICFVTKMKPEFHSLSLVRCGQHSARLHTWMLRRTIGCRGPSGSAPFTTSTYYPCAPLHTLRMSAACQGAVQKLVRFPHAAEHTSNFGLVALGRPDVVKPRYQSYERVAQELDSCMGEVPVRAAGKGKKYAE
jgi:hypothetical protein